MNSQRAVEGVPGHLREWGNRADAGVVDNGMDAPEGIDGRLYQTTGAFVGRDVVTIADGLAALGLDLGHHFGRVLDVVDDHPGAP